jgi:hypothetical protein
MIFLFEKRNLITEGKLLYYAKERETWEILSVYYKTLFSNHLCSVILLSSILNFLRLVYFSFHFFLYCLKLYR